MHHWKLNQILTQVNPQFLLQFLYIVEISFCLDQNIWPDLGVNKIASPMGKIKGNLEKWSSSHQTSNHNPPLEKFGRKFEPRNEAKKMSLIRRTSGGLRSCHLPHLGRTQKPKINLYIP
jgi:hypothetical protein